MSQRKSLVTLLVLSLIVVVPIVVLAADPDAGICFPDCFAGNVRLPNTGTPGDGTRLAPWVAPTLQERLDLRTLVGEEAAKKKKSGKLTMVNCESADDCAYIEYTYDRTGKEESGEPKPGTPIVGVPMPIPYMVGIGMLLAAALIVAGITLRRRAQLGRA